MGGGDPPIEKGSWGQTHIWGCQCMITRTSRILGPYPDPPFLVFFFVDFLAFLLLRFSKIFRAGQSPKSLEKKAKTPCISDLHMVWRDLPKTGFEKGLSKHKSQIAIFEATFALKSPMPERRGAACSACICKQRGPCFKPV